MTTILLVLGILIGAPFFIGLVRYATKPKRPPVTRSDEEESKQGRSTPASQATVRRTGRFFVVAALLIGLVGVTLFYVFFPKDRCNNAIQRIPIILKGDSVLSEPVSAPKGMNVYYIGSPAVRIRFADGTGGPLSKWYGVKPNPFWFSGPKGDTVLVDIVPLK